MTDDPKMKKWQGYFPVALIDEVTAWGKARGHTKTADAMRVLIRRALDMDKPASSPTLPPEIVEALTAVGAELGAADQADTIRRLLRIAAAADAAPSEPEPTKPAKPKRSTKVLGLF